MWIENGVVKNLDYDRYWAQKQGRAPDGREQRHSHERRHGDASMI